MRNGESGAAGWRRAALASGAGVGAACLGAALVLSPGASGQAEPGASETTGVVVPAGPGAWWDPGETRPLEARVSYANDWGALGVVNAEGPVETAGHPFFEPLGSNGRACVSCHQPSDGMSLSVATIQSRWEETGGTDPIFAAVDGMNCPHLPAGDPASHSLLLERGLFRVFLPWPPRGPDGEPIEPEFDIEVVRDPTGCNTHAQYGLESENPTVSVYRRPRVVANMKYVTDGGGLFNIKDGSPMARDPETGRPTPMNIMADAREPTLRTQAQGAAGSHLEHGGELTRDQLDRIEAFERQIYIAQVLHDDAGLLAEEGGPPGLGPDSLRTGEPGLGDNFRTPVFGHFEMWREPVPGETPDQRDFRESVARGHDVFFVRPFWIRDTTHINTVGLGNPVKRTCATCHNARGTGMDAAPGWIDIGTTNYPWAEAADIDPGLPLFRLTCKASAAPHPFLGREILTHDPGRALANGRCQDIGAITAQQMRGLAARAPYFSNGSAVDLRALVDFYDERFSSQYSEQEKQDLVNFLSVL